MNDKDRDLLYAQIADKAEAELRRAHVKFGDPPTLPHAVEILKEEVSEIVAIARGRDWGGSMLTRLEQEATQTAAMALKIMVWAARARKKLQADPNANLQWPLGDEDW